MIASAAAADATVAIAATGESADVEVILLSDVEHVGLRGDGDFAGGGNQFVPAGATAQQESADFPAAADDDIPF